MGSITESIDVEVPVSTAYNQWTQFESFPHFMEGVESIRQEGETLTHWKIKVGGVTREFDARITEQRPDERIAWESLNGPRHAGVVTFHRLDEARSRVTAQIDIDPEGLIEKAGDALGFVTHRTKGDLQRFKDFVESQGAETGAWRGEVDQPNTS